MNVLITGGRGFIGTHLASELEGRGLEVALFDSFDVQVHPAGTKKPSGVIGDVRDRSALSRAMGRADLIVHFAAAVGVGQSQYDIERYVDVNVHGTAMLLDIAASMRRKPKKILVAGSMSSYGEGLYLCDRCGRVRPPVRTKLCAPWDPPCPLCAYPIKPIPIRETDERLPQSVYAVTKSTQEDLVRVFGEAYSVPTVVMRFFNVIGPGQSLSNPYTGVAAIFLSRLLSDQPPIIYEDGLQSRDFIHVKDVARACADALLDKRADGRVFNVGAGCRTSVLDLYRILSEIVASSIEPKFMMRGRKGDVRHCFADISAIQYALNFTPKVSIQESLNELVDWSSDQRVVDRVQTAHDMLRKKGLA